jgi:hypothetical protein
MIQVLLCEGNYATCVRSIHKMDLSRSWMIIRHLPTETEFCIKTNIMTPLLYMMSDSRLSRKYVNDGGTP